MQKQFLTSSVYSFESLRNGSFLYVDKTEYIWKLVESANAMYFLSRPRRFGKSLTISTLKASFKDKKNFSGGLPFMTSLMTGSRTPSFIWIWAAGKVLPSNSSNTL